MIRLRPFLTAVHVAIGQQIGLEFDSPARCVDVLDYTPAATVRGTFELRAVTQTNSDRGTPISLWH